MRYREKHRHRIQRVHQTDYYHVSHTPYLGKEVAAALAATPISPGKSPVRIRSAQLTQSPKKGAFGREPSEQPSIPGKVKLVSS